MDDDPEDAAHRMGLHVIRRRLPGTMWGATDGHSTIWIDDRLSQTEARCTLAHELVHVHARHATCQTPKVERWVRLRTAEWLISWDSLWSHRHSADLYDIADRLDVTRHVLLDRLHHLSDQQKHRLTEGLAP